MEQVTKNLLDPSWWFTGIFFVLVGLLLTKLFFDWLPKAIGHLSKSIPGIRRGLYRRTELAIAQKVKRSRQFEVRVQWMIARYWSIATICILYMGFALAIYLIYPRLHGVGESKAPLLALFLPAYVLQFVVMWEKRVVQRVVQARVEWIRRGKRPHA